MHRIDGIEGGEEDEQQQQHFIATGEPGFQSKGYEREEETLKE